MKIHVSRRPPPPPDPRDPRLELMLRAARPWPIERFVDGSLVAMVDSGLTTMLYQAYCAKWLERRQGESERVMLQACHDYGFALLRLWRYWAAVKTGRWPKGSLACAPNYARQTKTIAKRLIGLAAAGDRP